MGKQLSRKHSTSQFQSNRSGCMQSILHLLDYHHWHNVRKMLPHKRHGGERHTTGKVSPKSISLNGHAADEVQEIKDAGEDYFFVDQGTNTILTSKRSGKSHIKSLDSKGMSKEENNQPKVSCFPTGPQLQRTYSIHHLKPSDHRLHEGSIDWKHPVIFVQSIAKAYAIKLLDSSRLKATEDPDRAIGISVNRKLIDSNRLNGDISHHADGLEVSKVSREFFLKAEETLDVGNANNFLNPRTRLRLTKSGSFPVPDISHGRNFTALKLNHKQYETWSFRKGEKLLSGTQASKFVASKSSDNLYAKSMYSTGDDKAGDVLNEEAASSSCGVLEGSNDQKRNQAFIYALEDDKKIIKHSIKEIKNESDQTFMETALSVDGRDGSKCGHETDTYVFDLGKGKLYYIRRTSSLNESLHKYSQLFEGSFQREAKLQMSKSLKLTKEVEASSGGRVPKTFRRILSLPDFSLPIEGAHDTLCSGMPAKTVSQSGINIGCDDNHEVEPVDLPINTEKHVQADTVVDNECQNTTIEGSDSSPRTENQPVLPVGSSEEGTVITSEFSEDMIAKIGESRSYPEKEIGFSKNNSREFTQRSSVSVLEMFCQDEIACPAEFQLSEGSELKARGIPIDEPKSSADNHILHIRLDNKNDSEFNYVRDVVEQSGVIENEYTGSWNSVFDEVEACLPNETEPSLEEVDGSCDRQLLLDLVNELLLEIYERSYTYYPRVLSSSCHIHPMPMGHHVLKEVWTIISGHLSSRSELDQSLNYVMAQDLAKGDGWMNLQSESECVALELEDIIFDELLDEIISR